jgi:rare lipoprotein A
MAFAATECGRGSAPIGWRISYRWGWDMAVGRWRIVCHDRLVVVISTRSQCAVRSLTGLAAIAPIVATLAACAPSPFLQNRTQFSATAPGPTASRQTGFDLRTVPSSHIARHSVVRKVTVAKKPDPAIPAVLNAHPAAKANSSSYGVASFYTEDEWTASGERFNTHAMTAAHPTLPFGTRLRVTNITNGRSVVVRVNDRGPFVPGRVVDLSGSAAESLGMVERGIVKVKLDVVQKSSGSTPAKQF